MQSAMQIFVARFASKDPRICGDTDAKRITNIGCVSLCICGDTNAGVLRLRLRMTTKSGCVGRDDHCWGEPLEETASDQSHDQRKNAGGNVVEHDACAFG